MVGKPSFGSRPRIYRHCLWASKNSPSRGLVFLIHAAMAGSENWRKTPSPRISDVGTHFGVFRLSGTFWSRIFDFGISDAGEDAAGGGSYAS